MFAFTLGLLVDIITIGKFASSAGFWASLNSGWLFLFIFSSLLVIVLLWGFIREGFGAFKKLRIDIADLQKEREILHTLIRRVEENKSWLHDRLTEVEKKLAQSK